MIKLEKTKITPKFDDFILEHGNGYLIEERIEGISLREYTYLNNPLISLEKDVSKIKNITRIYLTYSINWLKK